MVYIFIRIYNIGHVCNAARIQADGTSVEEGPVENIHNRSVRFGLLSIFRCNFTGWLGADPRASIRTEGSREFVHWISTALYAL